MATRIYEEKIMKCVICTFGETEFGTTTVTVNDDRQTIVVKNVPADVCDACGEGYMDEVVADRLQKTLEDAAQSTSEVVVLSYSPVEPVAPTP